MAGVSYPVDYSADEATTLYLGLTQCTIANATRLKGPAPRTSSVAISSRNCVFANVSGLSVDSYVTIGGDYNGFYSSSLPSFGTHNPDPPGSSPFQSSGGGHYYLSGSSFRGKGSTAINAAVLSALKTRTTQPPIDFPRDMKMTGELTLFPQIPRYVSGPPDLGYHYDALDYTVARMNVEGGAITIEPGTAIGIRMEFIDVDIYTFDGFEMKAGSTFISHGFPDRPNVFADVQQVQENVPWPAFVTFLVHYDPNAENLLPPTLDFRFSNFYLGGGGPLLNQMSFHFMGGLTGIGNLISYNCASFVTLRDCNLSGGQLEFGKAWSGSGPASVTWINNVFDRVAISIDPNWPDEGDPTIYVDLAFQAYNNTFHGSLWFHLEPTPTSDGGRWTLKDNLFDKVDFVQNTDQPLDYDYNAYWPLTEDELNVLYDFYPWAPFNYAQLLTTTPVDDLNGGNEVGLTVAPPYQTGPLGNFYLPTSSELYNSLKRGSRGVPDAGLFHYTTRTDQTKDGNQSGNVIIGRHYLATLNSSSTSPKDSDVGSADGVPDYVEDANGNGVWDSATETKVSDTQTIAGVNDSVSTMYDDSDLSGSGLSGRLKKAFGIGPFDTSSPLALGVLPPLANPDLVRLAAPLQFSLLSSIGHLELLAEGYPVTFQRCDPAIDGSSVVTWDTTYNWSGLHFAQIRIYLNGRSLPDGVGSVAAASTTSSTPPYQYMLIPGSSEWATASVEECLNSATIPASWQANATSWQLFSSVVKNPYFRGIWITGTSVSGSYSAAKVDLIPVLSTLEASPDFGADTLRYLASVDLPTAGSSDCSELSSPCFLDYRMVAYMASLDASLNSLDSASLRRLFELAVWDANYCASTFQTILATQPMGLAYAIYNRPGFAATLPTGATLPSLTSDESVQIDSGQLPQELVSPFADLKTALGLVRRP